MTHLIHSLFSFQMCVCEISDVSEISVQQNNLMKVQHVTPWGPWTKDLTFRWLKMGEGDSIPPAASPQWRVADLTCAVWVASSKQHRARAARGVQPVGMLLQGTSSALSYTSMHLGKPC